MKVNRWLDFFKTHSEKSLFSLSDLLVLTGEDESSIGVQLTRLVNAGIIERVARGWYENPFNPPNPEEISMVLRYPSYLSLEYALSTRGILSQRAVILTLVTTKNTYTYSAAEREYEYHRVKPELFFGYERQGPILIAEPEKALLDLVYIRMVHGGEMKIEDFLSLLEDMETEELDAETLSNYKSKFGKPVEEALERANVPA